MDMHLNTNESLQQAARVQREGDSAACHVTVRVFPDVHFVPPELLASSLNHRMAQVANRFAKGIALVMLLAWASSARALMIEGSNADKQNFLAYLNNQGAAGGAAFAYAGVNANQNGVADLISGPGATNNFGVRMAVAADDRFNGLTVHVGRNIPRMFFGAFQWDPAVGGGQAGHQTIDLADIFAINARNPNHLEGGTDILLHEIFEGLTGLGGGGFDPAHFTNGYQEENSNRAADNSRGRRVVPQNPDQCTRPVPPADCDRLTVHPVTGAVEFRTAWQINDAPTPRRGDLVIRGQAVGGTNYTVNSIQFGLLPAGSDDGTAYDIQFVEQFFVETATVPEPTALALMGIGLAGLAVQWRRKLPRA